LALSNLPERNPFFTGREQVLTQLQEALAAQGRAALSGLGGVGKTQTAVEYAHCHLKEYDCILWVTAASQESLVSGYVTVAGLLKLPEAHAKDQTLAVDAIKRWFSSNERWLLILDNADDLKMVREFIPSRKSGHVLLTTRAGVLGPIARRVEILEMGTEEGALFLLRRAKYIAEDASIDIAVEGDQARAKEITTQHDGLPLALDQAAAYIEETSCGLSGYLSLYREHAPELLRRRGVLVSDHPDPVASTWALSFEKIDKANLPAAELLKFCSFLHPDAIPEEVFSEGAMELGPELQALASDGFRWNNTISNILKYSLLRRDPAARTLEIHRLVQKVLKQGMDENTQRRWAERAVRAVNRAFPDVKFTNWPLCGRLLSQAHAGAQLINQWGFKFPEAARLLNESAVYLFRRGRYTDAEALFERSLAIREETLSSEHPDTAWSLHNLAVLYDRQHHFSEAELLYQRALRIFEKVHGPDHPDVAWCLNDLAGLYYIQGQYAKVEPVCKRALEIREKVLGPEHPDTAESVTGLAVLYYTQGKYAEAEPLYQQALATREKVLGLEHPAAALILNNLAALYHSQDQYTKAEPLYQRALAIREKALGPDHPDVANSLSNLAALYYNQGQYAKAEPLYRRALAILEEALDPEHPDAATSLESYAHLLRNMGRPDEAAPFESRARAIRAKTKSA